MKTDWPIKKLGGNYLKLFSIFVLVLILAHGFFDDFFKIDNTSVLLLLILVLLPYLPLIKKIKFGDFEAEISSEEIRSIETKAKEIPEDQRKIRTQKTGDLKGLAEKDPALALAKARIEIEKRIRVLGQIYLKNVTATKLSLKIIIDELTKKGILELSLGSLLRDVIAVANRAIHGESVSKDNAVKLAELTNEALDKLDDVVINRALKSESSKIITTAEMKSFMGGNYVLKTIIPYVKNPEIRIYNLNQAELDAFLEGYEEFAEFIISLERKK